MLTLPTTTVTIGRPAPGDPYEPAATTVVETERPATISAPTGREMAVGGSQEVVDAVLLTTPDVSLTQYDTVTDNGTGEVWQVSWVRRRLGLGLDHTQAGLMAVKGGAR